MTEPIRVRTKGVAKALAAELALNVLKDESSGYHLPRLCDCNSKGSEAKLIADVDEDEEEEEGGREGPTGDLVQEDETEEGFALLAQCLVREREGRSRGAVTDQGESSDMDISGDEIGVDSQFIV